MLFTSKSKINQKEIQNLFSGYHAKKKRVIQTERDKKEKCDPPNPACNYEHHLGVYAEFIISYLMSFQIS